MEDFEKLEREIRTEQYKKFLYGCMKLAEETFTVSAPKQTEPNTVSPHELFMKSYQQELDSLIPRPVDEWEVWFVPQRGPCARLDSCHTSLQKALDVARSKENPILGEMYEVRNRIRRT